MERQGREAAVENMKTVIQLTIVVIALIAASAAGAQMKARVAWTSFASNMSGTWVAQEEGLFKKNGLEVELVHIPSTSRTIQVLLAGELAYTYMDGRTAVQATLRGADAVIVAGVANRLGPTCRSTPSTSSGSGTRPSPSATTTRCRCGSS